MTSEGDAVGRAAATTLATDKGSLLAAFAAEAYERGGRRLTDETARSPEPAAAAGSVGDVLTSGRGGVGLGAFRRADVDQFQMDVEAFNEFLNESKTPPGEEERDADLKSSCCSLSRAVILLKASAA